MALHLSTSISIADFIKHSTSNKGILEINRYLYFFVTDGHVETITIITRFVSLCILYAIHLNDNSLFCVFTDLDVTCSPNNRFMTEIMVSSLFLS